MKILPRSYDAVPASMAAQIVMPARAANRTHFSPSLQTRPVVIGSSLAVVTMGIASSTPPITGTSPGVSMGLRSSVYKCPKSTTTPSGIACPAPTSGLYGCLSSTSWKRPLRTTNICRKPYIYYVAVSIASRLHRRQGEGWRYGS